MRRCKEGGRDNFLRPEGAVGRHSFTHSLRLVLGIRASRQSVHAILADRFVRLRVSVLWVSLYSVGFPCKLCVC